MTITAPNGNAEPIRVLRKRHRYFVFMPGEKRLVLTRGQARDLHIAVDLADDLFHSWIGERFDRMIEGKPVADEPDPSYEIPFLQHVPNSDDLGMLRAWLKDALYGWGDPYYRSVRITKESRANAERLVGLLNGDPAAIAESERLRREFGPTI